MAQMDLGATALPGSPVVKAVVKMAQMTQYLRAQWASPRASPAPEGESGP
jgi:hypothetical protein